METNQYRTSGVIDESTFREINRVTLSRKYIWGTRTAAVAIAVLAAHMLAAREYFFFAILAFLALVLFMLPKWLLKSYLDGAVKRMNETYPAGYIQMETWFTDEGMAVHNLSDGGQLVLPYRVLNRVAETERYFYIVTKSNQFNLVFKELLTPEQKRGFLPFLQGRCPDIKVVR